MNLIRMSPVLQERLETRVRSMQLLRERSKLFSKNIPLNRYLAFAQTIEERAMDCEADVYVGHGVQALPAVDRLRELTGGKAVCDAIEIPSFAQRAVPSKWDPIVLKMIDHGFEGYLRRADFLTTVGWALGDILKTINPDVRVIPNYRKFESYDVNHKLRNEFGIADTEKVILCISTIATGVVDVIEALAKLRDGVHLVFVGKFVPASYKDTVLNEVNRLGLGEQIHFRDPIPYNEMTAYCAGADIGLIVRDPAIPNNYISLPNRVFDYIAAGLPIVTPYMPDISKILADHSCGISIDDISSTSWLKGIKQAFNELPELRENTIKAREVLCWENVEEDGLEMLFDKPNSVCFVGFNDLSKNNRTMRVAASLVQKGISVKIASPIEDPKMLPTGVHGIVMRSV